MADVDMVKLTSSNSELICNPQFGADITRLTLSGKALIIPRGHDQVENPWLFPFPNRLSDGKYEFAGKAYQFPHNDYGRPNALHGFVLDQPFQLGQQTSSEVELNYRYDGHLVYYPFAFDLSISYKLSDSELVINMGVVNRGGTSMPAGLGWHPYFHLASGKDHASLQLPTCEEIEVDDLMIPTGKKQPSTCFDAYRNLKGVDLDTCFEVVNKGKTNAVGLKSGDDYEISIWQDAAHEFIQVYTPDDGQSIAIEPMTCGIDAFNTKEGLKILEAGETWKVSCGVKLK